jgi:hypothetical protein
MDEQNGKGGWDPNDQKRATEYSQIQKRGARG